MSVLRARMKPGCRPVCLGGAVLVPAYPTYWEVPASEAAAVELLAQDGQVEYEARFTRGANGYFAPVVEPALQRAQTAAVERRPAPEKVFRRKGR